MLNVIDDIRIRQATRDDHSNIGKLHAQSWMSAYRGLLADSYLDNDLPGERTNYWNKKMSLLSPREFVLVAEQGNDLAGFIALIDRPEKEYDAFIDNLHVRPDLKGKGIGRRLMRVAAQELLKTDRKSVYLWVLKGNVAAEAFYKSRGGRPVDTTFGNFGGTIISETRFVWDTLDTLLKD